MKTSRLIHFLFLLFTTSISYAQLHWVNTFESFPLEKQDTFWNGADSSGGFEINGAFFENSYNGQWKSWSGFAVSNMRDSSTPGFQNQYSVFNTSGVNHTDNFIVANGSPKVILPEQMTINGFYVCNATYAALSMRDGDGFAKKFGGSTGDDPDYLKLIIHGWTRETKTKLTEVFLADYRFDNNAQDYILNNWKYVDLSDFKDLDSIQFELESTDNGNFGMNTPAYFCLDNFNASKPSFFGGPFQPLLHALDFDEDYRNGSEFSEGLGYDGAIFMNNHNPQWGSWDGFSLSKVLDTTDGSFQNQYAPANLEDKGIVAVGYQKATLLLTEEEWRRYDGLEFQVTNSYYAYHSMKHGSAFNKKMGGTSGNDPDYFVLKAQATYWDGSKSDTTSHYLADFRFEDDDLDFIQQKWQVMNIPLDNTKMIARLDFWLEGSDTGQFGLNTPAYFCMAQPGLYYLGLEEKEMQHIQVFPNPASQSLQIVSDAEVLSYRIFNLSGQQVAEETYAGKDIIDVSSLPVGLYILHAETLKGTVTTKWIKQ
jgi:hypothetical protein